MKIYKANRKGGFKYILIGSIIFPIIFFLVDKNKYIEQPLLILLLLIPMLLLTWIYFGTYYKIENGKLFYQSAFLRGYIEISSIQEIQIGKTLWMGIKPALARNGLIIKSSKINIIYIAPENNQELIADLLKSNPQIKISE
ncbi:MAG TPA: PH domain-containing protein [Chitinophagales bacterium]|nr:PH domain-containing protein [Chitinophagales bacterium]